MPKPSTVPTWATNTLFSTGAGVGLPTKNSPSSIAADGWNYVFRPNPTHHNHWMNAVGVWLGWVNTDVFSTEGGSYTLLDVLTLTGAGLSLNLEVTHPAGEQIFENGEFVVTATGEITVQSGGELTLASGSTILGDPNFGGGTWTWAAPQIVDTTTLTFAGTGHMRNRGNFALNTSGSQSIGINNGDNFSVPLLSGTLSLTLLTTGAGTGAELTIEAHQNIASGFSATVTTAEGSYFMRADTGGIYTSSLTVKFYGGAWHTKHAVLVP